VPSVLEAVGPTPRRRLLAGDDPGVRSDGPWFAEFCRVLCRQQIGRWAGLPLELYPEQQAFFDDALSFDDEGERLYRMCVEGVPRKGGKSTALSALSLATTCESEGEGKPLCLLAAGSREQGAPLFDQARDFVNAHPSLLREFDPLKTAIAALATGGSVQRVAGDGKLNHGLSPYRVLADELHAWVTPKQVENWAALTTADGARDDAQFYVISTAGWDLGSVLGLLFQQAFENPLREMRPDMGSGGFVVRDPANGLLVHWYAVSATTGLDDVEDFKRANPAPWRTVERLARDLQKVGLDEPTKRRLYGNQWTSARAQWIPSESWAHAVDESVADGPPSGSPVCIGVDVGLVGDTTAVAWAWLTEDGRVAIDARVWSARDSVAHDVWMPGGRVDLEQVELFIVEFARRHRVVELGYDPRFFERSAQQLSKAGLRVYPIDQGSKVADTYQAFYDVVVRDQRLAHSGNPVLAAHVAAAAGVKTERGWKVSKLRSSTPIDALVASAMASWRISEASVTSEMWVAA